MSQKVLSLVCLIVILTQSTQALDTVTELDLQAYLGTWYEVVASPIIHWTIEIDAYCARATYSLNDDGTIGVLNQQRQNSVTGKVTEIQGQAYQPDPSQPGKLKVNFGFPREGDYQIIRLGPLINGQYQYSVVSDEQKLFMWVLARNPVEYKQNYLKDVKNYLINEQDFTSIANKYTERSQEGCLPYETY